MQEQSFITVHKNYIRVYNILSLVAILVLLSSAMLMDEWHGKRGALFIGQGDHANVTSVPLSRVFLDITYS